MQCIHEPEGAPMSLFQLIVEQAPDAMIYADCEGVVRIWNLGAETVFGYTAAEILGKGMDVIIPERFRRAHWEGFRKAFETGQTKYKGRVLTTRAVHKDGSKRYVDLSFSMVKDRAGIVIGVLAIARDCTERQLATSGAPRS
jgi:PAS domain S-box-containing protein